jgi:hypothetical protein
MSPVWTQTFDVTVYSTLSVSKHIYHRAVYCTTSVWTYHETHDTYHETV